MDSFFKWIWRVNGLLVLIAVLSFIAIFSLEYFEHRTSDTSDPVITNIAADPEGKEQWVLDHPQLINGTDYSYIRLNSANKNVQIDDGTLGMINSYSNSRNSNAKNILFIDERGDNANWLFNDTNQVIKYIDQLPRRTYGVTSEEEHTPTTSLLIYTIVNSDSNTDGVINDADAAFLAISDVEGGNFQIVLENFERLLSSTLLDKSTLSVLYQVSGQGFHVKYSLVESKILSTTKLPVVGE